MSIEYNLKRTVSGAALHLKGRMIEVMEAKVEGGEEESLEAQWSGGCACRRRVLLSSSYS